MVDDAQIKLIEQKLVELNDIIAELYEIASQALFSYRVSGQVKRLPQADIEALLQEYQSMKTALANKFKELP